MMRENPYSKPVSRVIQLRFDASILQSTLNGDFGNSPIEDGDTGSAL